MVRGQKRTIKKELELNIHNRFDLEVIDSKTGELKQRAYAENIVLEALWTRLLAPNTYFNYIHFGTGTGTLSANRTSLFTFLGAKAAENTVKTYEWNEGWISCRRSCQLAETENIGSELKEVGVGYGSDSTNLVTHALLKDMNGNPITILKTATDVINIYATVFVYWNVDGYDNGSIFIVNSTRNLFLTNYLTGISVSNKNLKSTITNYIYYKGHPYLYYPEISNGDGESKGGFIAIKNNIPITYNVSEKKIIGTATRLGVSEGNAPIKSISACVTNAISLLAYQPAINFHIGGLWYQQSSITGEAIATGDGIVKDFATDFPFVKSCKIYFNGVEQTSGFTVDTLKPFANNQMGIYFEILEENVAEAFDSKTQQEPLTFAMKGGWANNSDGQYIVGYNPLWEIGIDSFDYRRCKVEVSNDLLNWVMLVEDSTRVYATTYTVPSEYKTYKYWKFTAITNSYNSVSNFTSSALSETNIHFTTAPEAGAVITADYSTETIAKDANHVFDFSFEITLGEKTA